MIELDRRDRRLFDVLAVHNNSVPAQNTDIALPHDGHHLADLFFRMQRETALINWNVLYGQAHGAGIVAAEDRAKLNPGHARQDDRGRMGMHHRARVRMSFIKLAMNTRFVRRL